MRLLRYIIALHCAFLSVQPLAAQVQNAPQRKVGEGGGPYSRLIIRGVTLINSTGAPPVGPVDIVVEKNRIAQIQQVGYPGVPIDPNRRPQAKTGDRELNCEGMYLMPGMIDMHGHIGGKDQGTPSEYVFKLWMGHGITTIRDPSAGNGLDWVLEHRAKSDRNEIVAPRIKAYTVFGQGNKETITTPEQARAWVRQNAQRGADGIKFFGAEPAVFRAALDENKKLGLRSACHHAQLEVARMNVLATAKAGLTSMEHWYGLPEALFADRTVQDYPANYNYSNEQDRFTEAGNLWQQAAKPGTPRWNAVMDSLIRMDFTLDPTFNIYEANRELMLARRAEWHDDYTLPSLWRFYGPSRISHGSYWHDWGTEQEVAWKKNYQLWMQFINEFKNRGGRVTTGSDSGFIYQLYGFAYIRELELLREAGFHPLEVIRSATIKGAEALGMADQIGSVEVGKLADFAIMKENPLANLKTLYGTGAIHLNEKNEVERIGGVTYTVKDGVVYDAKQLLADVRQLVADAKAKENFEIRQPGNPARPAKVSSGQK
ncbi:amidohydrolase family protein [Fibrivirga algicola]|uniref:Amidohydrolase family protein n=1 Tax=Fibrivirga algicola TaxID=2950420 RepID=A0ABX0QMF6_9BACT|nr:amidohydrolase family protein [Fibrivirga algicola]ARK10276.1 amidohydrolase [Fibrella sp. ES10-3-2-2]NID11778.1 amidohydrolase family protein [Fibrivirga algicola]